MLTILKNGQRVIDIHEPIRGVTVGPLGITVIETQTCQVELKGKGLALASYFRNTTNPAKVIYDIGKDELILEAR